MKICLEATSLRGLRSGVGHTTSELATSLVECDPSIELTLFAMSAVRDDALRDAARRPRTKLRGGNPLVRAASWCFWRTELVPAELFCGRTDVFHGPNYLLPPLRRAAGVVTVYDLSFARVPEMSSPGSLRIGEVVGRTMRRAQRIITSSNFTASEIADLYPDVADRVRVVAVGVRDAFFAPHVAPAHSAARDPYLVFLGNLELRKGVDVLLEAFADVRRSVPEARLLLIGQPSVGWDEISAKYTDLLGTAAFVVGYAEDPAAASIMAGARAMVYPSRYEGFGMPPLEAMACGTRVIASNAASLPEVCGPHATYVDAGNAEALAAAMTQALATEPDPDAISAARSHARTFSWRRTATETIAVYKEAMEAR
jgi:glycosyltransferase involved in cell wall biosynthesis